MKISELESKTGLDRATIRYYEKECLIFPQRSENQYREYSQEDLRQLLKIKLLRQLNFPLEQIRSLQQGSEKLSDAIEAQIQNLNAEQEQLETAADICIAMKRAGETYESLDAQEYLMQMRKPSESGEAQAYHEPHMKTEVHPWRRFFARWVDMALLECIVDFLIVCVLRIRPYPNWASILVSIGCLFLLVPLESLMISKWGTTPGKLVMGIHISDGCSNKLSWEAALRREWAVLRYGLGFGIPIWEPWRKARCWWAYKHGESMGWDASCEYEYLDWKEWEKFVFLLFSTVIIGLNLITINDSIRPKYIDSYTVAQFAENYNYYHWIAKEKYSCMESDGSWESDGSERNSFIFETEGERVCRITYSNIVTVETFYSPDISHLIVCGMTAVMSQESSNLLDYLEFCNEGLKKFAANNATITINDVTIKWNVDAPDCTYWPSIGYHNDDETQPATLAFDFEIIIN